MTKHPPTEFDPNALVDKLYDIALDPGSLDGFIDAWNTAGLDGAAARRTISEIESFDATFQAHLKRAEAFLHRGENEAAPLSDALAPFENLAALIINRAHDVVASNEGARTTLGIKDGDNLASFQMAAEARDALQIALRGLMGRSDGKDTVDGLIKLELSDTRAPTLFQLRRLTERGEEDQELVLIVTTQYHWRPALGSTLEEVFHLTQAEQGVVRALVEGRDARAIAAERGTSEGTVRSQIKSILAKMNARSQSEIIRLVLSLRDVSMGVEASRAGDVMAPHLTSADWLDGEVWKPIQSITMADGRRFDFLDMGPKSGAPVVYSHMGYCMARWSHDMIRLAFQHGLRVICPIRAGYGQSDNLDPRSDVLAVTSADTLAVLRHLGITRLPYLTQGNDLIFATHLAMHHPDVVSEIIGLCGRPSLSGDRHYAGMAKWHRFFLSTARHAPHLLKFTSKAAVAMARRIGVAEMYRQMHKSSPADLALTEDRALVPILSANAALVASKTANVAQAYAMELLQTEADWSHQMHATKDTPTWFVSGAEDPSLDMATIAEYREAYPWITIEVMPNAGQMLIYQKYAELIPRIAEAARRAQAAPTT